MSASFQAMNRRNGLTILLDALPTLGEEVYGCIFTDVKEKTGLGLEAFSVDSTQKRSNS